MNNRVYSSLLLLFVFAFFISGCSSDSAEIEELSESVGELAPGVPATEKVVQTPATEENRPEITAVATVETSVGSLTIGLYGIDAPNTVENFVGLSKKGFYDGTRFHRVVPGFVVQGGDPQSRDLKIKELWGSGGESIYGGSFDDELNPESASGKIGYVEGVVAMANSGPNTQTSQFFVILSEEGGAHLPLAYTIFGKVLDGMPSVREIEKSGFVLRENRQTGKTDTLTSEAPEDPVLITKISISK